MSSQAHNPPKPTRRAVVASIAAFSAIEGLPWPSRAAAPAHVMRVGELEVIIISDGHLLVPAPMLATNVDAQTLQASLAQRAGRVEPPCNVTLVRTGQGLVLIDTGSGPHFMPTAGRLLSNLALAGIRPEEIVKVVFTHGHPDHLWGTLDDFDDSPNFPNAEYVITAAEWNFWASDDAEARLPDDRKNFARPAKKVLATIKDKVRTIRPGEDVAPNLRAVDTSGHTVGHIAIEIASGGEAVLVVGDALSHPVISFAHPDWTPAADHHDRDQAVRTRKSLLGRLATERTRLVGFHLPFPGVGRAESTGLAYRFEPDAP
jgi:glyoxylase-like metal-dependent hydrolase (beta-lactamase superfamily II)